MKSRKLRWNHNRREKQRNKSLWKKIIKQRRIWKNSSTKFRKILLERRKHWLACDKCINSWRGHLFLPINVRKTPHFKDFFIFRFRKNEKDEDSEFSSYTNLAVLRRPKLLKAELKQNYIEFSEESGLKDIAVCEYDPGRPAATVRWVDGLDGSALPSNFFKTTLTR